MGGSWGTVQCAESGGRRQACPTHPGLVTPCGGAALHNWAGSRIVGTVEYADYPEPAKAIPRIGSYHGIQIEQVLALKPDLVVAWRSGNKAADFRQA